MLKHSLRVFILRELLKRKQLSFGELRERLNCTEGNLGSALHNLVEEKFVNRQADLLPNGKAGSIYSITKNGKEQYEGYIGELWK